jgi:TetR/AcrR family transcriptional regulator
MQAMARQSRRERERQRHKQEILQAAEAVFAEKGFHRATVQEIARRADFAVGTIYNIFESKAAIYRELLESHIERFVERVTRELRLQRDPIRQVQCVIRVYLQFRDENQLILQILSQAMSSEEGELPVAMSDTVRKLYARYIKALCRVFAEGIRRKDFIDTDPLLMTLTLDGVMHAIITYPLHTSGSQLQSATPENIERILFNGMLTRGGGDGRK